MEPGPQGAPADARAASSISTTSTTGDSILICLLHFDLRIADNALWHFSHRNNEGLGDEVDGRHRPNDLSSKANQLLPLFVFDEREYELSGLPNFKGKGIEARTREYGFWKTGAFRTRFAAESVYDLRSRLRERGSDLCIRFGIAEEVVENLVQALQDRGDHVEAVWMEQESSAAERDIQKAIEARLKPLGTPVGYVYGKTLIHPDDLPFDIKDTPDVFTPFRKRVETLGDKMVRPRYTSPDTFKPFPQSLPHTTDYSLDVSYEVDVDGLSTQQLETSNQESGQISFYEILHHLLLPLQDSNFPPNIDYNDLLQRRHQASAFPFRGGESSALDRLDWYFVRGKSPNSSSWGTNDPPPVSRYKQTRNNLLGHAYSTKMSPFLAYGSISARQIWEVLDHHASIHGEDQNIYWVKFELLWRDYFHFVSEKFGDLLYHIGGFELATDPPQAKKKLDGYWKEYDPKTAGPSHELTRLLEGRTGIPFIDANIRELRDTGFLSNRGRQNIASYLAHDLKYDWRIGAELFESYLIDSAASCVNLGNWQYVSGVGNDPRASRRFNIVKQAKDYDSHGEYVKTWLPSLRGLPPDLVHTPWLLDAEERRAFALKTSEMAVTMDSYPARPLTEDPGWQKHYSRKAGEGSRMHGNPQEKIKDGRLPRSRKEAGQNRRAFDAPFRRGEGGGTTPPSTSSRGKLPNDPPFRATSNLSRSLGPPFGRRGSGGSSTEGSGSASGSASGNENMARLALQPPSTGGGPVQSPSLQSIPVRGNILRSSIGNSTSASGSGDGSPHRAAGSARPRSGAGGGGGGSGTANNSSGEGSGRDSFSGGTRARSKAEEALSWRRAPPSS